MAAQQQSTVLNIIITFSEASLFRTSLLVDAS